MTVKLELHRTLLKKIKKILLSMDKALTVLLKMVMIQVCLQDPGLEAKVPLQL